MATPVKDSILGTRRDNMSSRRRINKMLLFEEDGLKSTDAVDRCDSETEKRSEKESADAMDTLEERSVSENYEDEDVEACDVDESTPLSSRKRKRVIASDSEDEDEDVEACEVNKNTPLSGRERIQVVSSDSENYNEEDEDVEACEVDKNTPLSGRKRIQVIVSDSEYDDEEDNIPLSIILKNKQSNKEMSDLVDTPNKEESGSRRSRTHRRMSSILNKESVSKEMSASTARLVAIPTTDDVDNDETEEELESESESLNGFIVNDDSHEIVSEKSHETGEEESNGEPGYAEVMSRLRRDKKSENRKWEYEADMLADFGKDPELCMKAVCVLYRFQTDDEKVTRSSHICNGRGFIKFDAERGTRIGRFLTDGDPTGDLKKSVDELKSFEFGAVEICEKIAGRYSKQLFQIYNNREDPFFTLPPSP